MMAILLGAPGRPGLAIAPFGLSFSHHSLARLLDETAFAADPVQVMCQAHDALLVLEPADGEALFRLPDLILPAGPGAFLVAPDSAWPPAAIAKTWISSDQLRVHQERDLAAWRELLETL